MRWTQFLEIVEGVRATGNGRGGRIRAHPGRSAAFVRWPTSGGVFVWMTESPVGGKAVVRVAMDILMPLGISFFNYGGGIVFPLNGGGRAQAPAVVQGRRPRANPAVVAAVAPQARRIPGREEAAEEIAREVSREVARPPREGRETLDIEAGWGGRKSSGSGGGRERSEYTRKG
jgi:hypothetical protein